MLALSRGHEHPDDKSGENVHKTGDGTWSYKEGNRKLHPRAPGHTLKRFYSDVDSERWSPGLERLVDSGCTLIRGRDARTSRQRGYLRPGGC
jgi:hypothetical protein